MHDEERIGQPSDDFIQKVEQIIHAECCMTLSEIHEKCVDVYRIVLYDVILNQLNYRKLSARWSKNGYGKTQKKYNLLLENCFLSVLMKKRILCSHDGTYNLTSLIFLVCVCLYTVCKR